MQRIGEEFQKRSFNRFFKHNQKNTTKIKLILSIEASVLTTDAIDFGAIRGKGRFVEKNHRNYQKFHNLDIKRCNVSRITQTQKNEINLNQDEEIEFNVQLKKFEKLCKLKLNLSPETIRIFSEMGPLLPELTEFLNDPNKDDFHELKEYFEAFNIIHTTYLPYNNLLYALLIAKYLKIPTVITPFLHHHNIRYNSKSIFEILDAFDRIFACTHFEKEILIANKIYSEKIKVVPMGVDIDKFQKPKTQQFLKNFNIRGPSILFCGYKNYEKGALTLLKSIPYITPKIKPVTFIFIGPPTSAFNYTLAEIRNMKDQEGNSQDLEIINITPANLSGIFDPQKIGAFQLAKIYCMPSKSEAYGIAYLEAWATKKPVIAADFPAMHEVINDGKDGILVDFDNPEQLAENIISLLNDPEKITKFGENGFEKISKHNQWNSIALQTLNEYIDLINLKRECDEI